MSIPFTHQAEFGQSCADHHPHSDWAVLHLQTKAIGPKPYKVDQTIIYDNAVPMKTTLVANQAIDFCAKDQSGRCLRDPRTRAFLLPKHMADCEIKRVHDGKGYIWQLETDCPSGSGASGGALLYGDLNDPYLVGIETGASESEGESRQERKTGRPIIKPYSSDWRSIAVNVAGDFATRIYRAAGIAPPPLEDGLSPAP